MATAASGVEAFAQVVRLQPAAILLDLVLPDLDGLAVAQTLHEHPTTRGIPILAISALVPFHTEDVARGAGCYDFLTKPCHPDSVRDLLRAAIGIAG